MGKTSMFKVLGNATIIALGMEFLVGMDLSGIDLKVEDCILVYTWIALLMFNLSMFLLAHHIRICSVPLTKDEFFAVFFMFTVCSALWPITILVVFPLYVITAGKGW